MTTHPLAEVSYISSNDQRGPNTPRLVIFHTNAGQTSAGGVQLKRYIESQLANGNPVTQPHHQVDLSGVIWQFLDYERKGVASFRAEGFCISVETQDYGSRESSIDSQRWSDAQCESLAQICAYAHRAFGVPLWQADAWDGSGIGWHSMWGINTLLHPQRNPWTTQRGKTCPGAARIAQVDSIIHRARELVLPPLPPPQQEDDDMPRYLWLYGAPGKPESIVAIDGAGVSFIGLATGGDANALGVSLGAVRTQVTAAQYDEIVRASRARGVA